NELDEEISWQRQLHSILASYKEEEYKESETESGKTKEKEELEHDVVTTQNGHREEKTLTTKEQQLMAQLKEITKWYKQKRDQLVSENDQLSRLVEQKEQEHATRVKGLQEQWMQLHQQRKKARMENITLELKKMELQDRVNDLKECVDRNDHTSSGVHAGSNEDEFGDNDNGADVIDVNTNSNANGDYSDADDLSADTRVLQKLLRAQVEYYFGDYCLKRDKRLLDKIVAEPKGLAKIHLSGYYLRQRKT
ncbi:hypothetical protein RFI_20590, partial [Reticulomyxa filosa]